MILSKFLAVKLKIELLRLVVSCETTHVDGRFIDGRGLLILDIAEKCDLAKLSGYLTTIDFEIIFVSTNHNFLTATLKLNDFGEYFID